MTTLRKRSAAIALLLASFTLHGCLPAEYARGPAVWTDYPSAAVFPDIGLTYRANVNPDRARLALLSYFTQQGWPTHQELEGAKTFVMTVFIEEGEFVEEAEAQPMAALAEGATPDQPTPSAGEPKQEDDILGISTDLRWVPRPDGGRQQRAAYLIRIEEHEPGCSDIYFSWYVESRGLREETWRQTSEDRGTRPSIVPILSRGLENLGECNNEG